MSIKTFLNNLYKMSLKSELIYLKKARKLAKLRKIKAKNETLVENISFLLKDKFIKNL